MELVLELGKLADVLQSTLVELDLLITHDAAWAIVTLRGRIVQTLRHPHQNLLHFLILIMELISSRDIGLEKECDSLEQVVDVTEADIDIQSVLFLFVIRPKEVLFVRLRSRLVARDLDQFCHLNLQRKVSTGTRRGCQKQKEHIR